MNNTLKSLNLDSCLIGDNGARSIASIFYKQLGEPIEGRNPNDTLEKLSLKSNCIKGYACFIFARVRSVFSSIVEYIFNSFFVYTYVVCMIRMNCILYVYKYEFFYI